MSLATSSPARSCRATGPVALNAGRAAVTLAVANTGDRPVQVGSHFHFAEANAALRFDRDAAWGHRLDVPAGTAVRFEPGVDREVVAGAAGRAARRARPAGRRPAPGGGEAGRRDRARRRPAAGDLGERAEPRAVRAAVRPDRRRPDPAGRHRPAHRGRAGPVRGRRRGGLRRRQGDPRVDGPGGRDPGRGHARPGHHRRGHPRPLGHRQGRRRHPRRPDRRDRQGRQPRHHGRRPPGPGDRAVHRDASPATGGSSPPAASTATCT